MSDQKDGLKFPDIAPIDHPRHCQQYTNVLTRDEDDPIQVEEIDGLQIDLETLLAAATRRMRLLQAEILVLSDMNDNKKDKKIHKLKDTDLKRSRHSEDKPAKKLKSSDSPSQSRYNIVPTTPGSSSNTAGVVRIKVKELPPKVSEYEYEYEEQQMVQPPRVPINDTPSRFWKSIEPYCSPINHESVRLLEEMIKQDDDNDYYNVPALGTHFSQRWAIEDMKEEQSEGNRANVKTHEKPESNVEAVLKKANQFMEQSHSEPFGSLTKRLISAFVDENIMAPPDHESMLDSVRSLDATEGGNYSKPMKSLPPIPHAHKLESRIRMELIEQGILEADAADSKKEDEILTELMRCQHELKVVSNRNKDVLNQLLLAAKEELKKQEIQKKIESANTEVMEHYRRVMAARQKKRSLLKKEKDLAWKALRDRDVLIKQLNE
uniref:transcriptional adapter 3-like n=1 Tax=Ciona intestinalis TaxID=7719 RepID=UPI0000520DCE|nr:transcriptional adapter 3-like [Ciona intestinalis]|eukprot:XP_002126817.1 transcriptional adapter 3-like [Ciona intestinalis]